MTDPARPLLDRLLAHNAWAVRQVLEACAAIDEDGWRRAFDIGPGSLQATLVHVVGATHRWADRIGERPLRPSIEAGAASMTPADVLVQLDEASREISGVCRAVMDEGRLEETMTIAIERLPAFTVPREAAILHVLTHTLHHLAQALNMLRRLNVPALPELDVITFALEADASASSDKQ